MTKNTTTITLLAVACIAMVTLGQPNQPSLDFLDWTVVGLSLAIIYCTLFRGGISPVTAQNPIVPSNTYVEPSVSPQDIIAQAIKNKRFSQLRLDGASLRNGFYAGFRFEECSLRSADFSGAELTNTTWIGCDLTGANFNGAKIDGADFSRCPHFDYRLLDASIRSSLC